MVGHPNITARLGELCAPVAPQVQIELIDHLERLKELCDAAMAKGQFSAAINAEIARGKAAGLYTKGAQAKHPEEVVGLNIQVEMWRALLERSRAKECAK